MLFTNNKLVKERTNFQFPDGNETKRFAFYSLAIELKGKLYKHWDFTFLKLVGLFK